MWSSQRLCAPLRCRVEKQYRKFLLKSDRDGEYKDSRWPRYSVKVGRNLCLGTLCRNHIAPLTFTYTNMSIKSNLRLTLDLAIFSRPCALRYQF
jgi:hypothetical protein